MGRPKKNIMEIVPAEFPEFAGVVDTLSVEELDQKIAVYAKENEKLQQEFDDNEAIQSELDDLKEKMERLTGPLKDAQKAIKLKIRYLIQLVKDRGGEA